MLNIVMFFGEILCLCNDDAVRWSGVEADLLMIWGQSTPSTDL